PSGRVVRMRRVREFSLVGQTFLSALADEADRNVCPTHRSGQVNQGGAHEAGLSGRDRRPAGRCESFTGPDLAGPTGRTAGTDPRGAGSRPAGRGDSARTSGASSSRYPGVLLPAPAAGRLTC